MAYCKKCEQLLGQSASVKPHEDLKLLEIGHRLDGSVEHYRCKNCATPWERQVTPPSFGTKLQFWVQGKQGN